MEKKAYFISDLHLGARYIKDARTHEETVCRFLREITPRCCELYLLGDVLDFWFEYRTVVPRGFIRFFGALAAMADAGVRITWLTGNHDIWLFDYLRDEIGLEIVDGLLEREILGSRFVMEHGDGIGKLKPGFRLIRSIFRNRVCQKLGAAVHPRWLVGFAHRWSSHSRKSGGYHLPAEEALKPYIEFAKAYNSENYNSKARYFLFGHQHVLAREEVPEADATVAILGDWINICSYASFDGENLTISTFA